jgi:hypothetical protein
MKKEALQKRRELSKKISDKKGIPKCKGLSKKPLMKQEAPLKWKGLSKKTSDEKEATLEHKGLSKNTSDEKKRCTP